MKKNENVEVIEDEVLEGTVEETGFLSKSKDFVGKHKKKIIAGAVIGAGLIARAVLKRNKRSENLAITSNDQDDDYDVEVEEF